MIDGDRMSESSEVDGAGTSGVRERRKRSFPTPATILIGVLLVVWLLTFLIPSGEYQRDELGRPVPGSFETTDLGMGVMDRLSILLQSPTNGLYGIRDAETGFIGPWYSGTLAGGAQVFLFILAIGGFMTIVFKTQALDRGIAHLAHRFRAQGAVLIVVLSVLFGFLGSVMSWSDETLGFYALMIPLMLSLGYDRLVAVAVVTVAPFVGIIGSTVNPFRIGVASDAADVTMGDGIVLRVVLLVLCMAAMIWYTLRYAKRVRADPSTSLVGFDEKDREILEGDEDNAVAPLTGRHKVIIVLVALTFVLLTFSIVPWGAILGNTKIADDGTHLSNVPFSWELGWWLPELSVLFIIMAIAIGVVGKLREQEIAGQFLKWVADFSGPAFLVVLAQAISMVLQNTRTIDTVLHAMEGFVSGTSSVVFVGILAIISLPLGFLVGSGSAGMALTMPILAPLGDFGGVDRSLVISTYAAVGAWLNLVLPLNVILVAGLALARVGFNVYLKFIGKLMGILAVIILLVLLVPAVFT